MKKILITGDQDYDNTSLIQRIIIKIIKNNKDLRFATYGKKYGADFFIQQILNEYQYNGLWFLLHNQRYRMRCAQVFEAYGKKFHPKQFNARNKNASK